MPRSDGDKRGVIRSVFGDVGWETPRILEVMNQSGEIYFDRVSQIRLPAWTKGRVALVGDAGACVSLLAGEGTGLAIAEAYVLAGELERSNGDFAEAFRRYEALLMPFLQRKQAAAAGFASSFAPRTALGIWFRNLVTRLLGVPFIANYFVGRDMRDDLILPEYTYAAAPAGQTLRTRLG
jgi:2-polyprenyl-6-methoxyphenol hydroxylase-like FAD-dependent oxidoreductase